MAATIDRLDQVKEGSTLMILMDGVEHQVMVMRVSRCQIDVSGMKKYAYGFDNFYRSFTTKGKVKYLKNENSAILKVLTL